MADDKTEGLNTHMGVEDRVNIKEAVLTAILMIILAIITGAVIGSLIF